MGVGKYSPTVTDWYMKNQKWWEENGGGEIDINYDKDGYDSYGYDKDGVDRAGYHESDYSQGEWVEVGDGMEDYVYNLCDNVYYSWNKPVPKK